MFRNMKMATKLILGFGSVLVLMVAVGAIGYQALDTAGSGFSEYREFARDTNIAGRVQANLLMVRMNVKDFLITGSQKDIDQFNEYWALVTKFMKEADERIKAPELQALLTKAQKDLDTYHDAFEELVKVRADRNDMVENTLDKLGPRMEKNLSEIMRTADRDGDATAAFRAGNTLRNLLLARLYVTKFLMTNAQAAVDRVQSEFMGMYEELGLLNSAVQDMTRRRLLAETAELAKEYEKTFADVTTLIFDRNKRIVTGTLDALGPVVAHDVEEVKLGIMKQQDVLGPQVQESNDRATMQIIALAVAAIVIGFLITWLIIRTTLRTLGGEPGDLAVMAQQVAVGDLRMKIHDRAMTGSIYQAMGSMIAAEREVVGIAGRLADGDLRVNVRERSENDQLMRALREMVERLGEVVSEVASGAENVSSGSEQMSSSSETLSQGATEQASSVEECSSSMEEMTASINQNADNARQTETIALKAAQDARESGEAVTQTVAAMKEIAGKISIIEEIARQTDLLALNAAVEAARAGEHGKGFAVVASEVRKLAERSQKAAAEINRLSGESTDVAEKAGGLLVKLVPDIQKTADLVQEITAASSEQSAGGGQVNAALQQLDQVVQQNAAASEELASTAEELASQAEQLQSTVAFFQMKENGGGRGRNPGSAPEQTAPSRPALAPATPAGAPSEDGRGLNLALDDESGETDDRHFERF